MKPLTKSQNSRWIVIYSALAIIFASIGIYTGNSLYILVAFVLIILVFIRKYWLGKRLRE